MKIARMNSEGKIKTVIIKGNDELFQIDDSVKFYDISGESIKGKKPLHMTFRNGDLLVPLPKVTSIRDFYTFEDHVRKARERRGLGMAKEWYEVPAYYYSGTSMIYPSG